MRLFCAAVVLAGLVTAGTAKAADAEVVVGSAEAFRNSVVIVPIRFQGDGVTVEFSADIAFSTTQLSLAAPPEAAGGATCTEVSSGRVRVSASSGSPLPADVRYCDLRLRVSATATGGVEPLMVDTASCTDDLSNTTPCQSIDGAITIAGLQTNLPDGFTLLIAGYESAGVETRRLRITNQGAAALTVDCDLDPSSDVALSIQSAPTSIPVDETQDVVVACALPAVGTSDRLGILTCTTSDAQRPLLRYNLVCSTVPDGEPLPSDQLLDNQLKDGDQLGSSAAQGVSAGEDLVILGAPFAGGDSQGAVLIYEGDTQLSKSTTPSEGPREGTPLRRVAMLRPPPRKDARKGMGLDRFGIAVAISSSSQRIAVGAPNGGANGTGAVYVYKKPEAPGSWKDINLALPEHIIDAPAASPGMVPSEFGSQVAFGADGDLVIGAPATTIGAQTGSGAVFRYQATGNNFDTTTPDTLTSVAPTSGGRFGEALAVNDSMLVVGAPKEGAGGSQEGAAYSFGVIGDTFSAPQSLSTLIQQSNQRFGSSVALSGTTIVVGSPGTDTAAGVGSGAATVYQPVGNAVQPQTMLLPDVGAAQGSGGSVAANGDVIVVGAPDADDGEGAGQGVAYTYPIKVDYSNTETALQKLRSRGGRGNDRFGRAVSIGQRQIVVGTPLRDLILANNAELTDVGQGDPFVLERVFKSGFER
jgi:hypothetical protein